VVFLAADVAVAAWLLATVVFLVAEADVLVAVPVFFVVAAVREDLTIVVPEETLEAVVPVLILRSCCWCVASRGDFTDAAAVLAAGLVAVFLGCEGVLLSFVAVVAVPFVLRARALSTVPATTGVALSGLEGFSGDAGRDIYERWCCCFSGEFFNGECGYVLELEDLGERILASASLIAWDTARDGPGPVVAPGLTRFFGISRTSSLSVGAGAFSLFE